MNIEIIKSLELKDVITSCIALINIFATISLTIINVFFLHRMSKFSVKRDVFCKYYLPIAEKLYEIAYQFDSEKGKDFIFDADVDGEIWEIRKSIIETKYKSFLEFEKSLGYYYYDKDIDNDIKDIKEHIYFIVYQYYKKENNYQIDDVKKKYPIPGYKETAELIMSKR